MAGQQKYNRNYFYPRPPRGGRLLCFFEIAAVFVISIHALREEGDLHSVFGPRLLVAISIHALREEGDLEFRQCLRCFAISIHALREEGDWQRRNARRYPTVFLSTPSARRATQGPQ